MRLRAWAVRTVLVLACAVAAASCGGKSPTEPSAEPEEIDIPATVPGPGALLQDVEIAVDAQVRATLTWTDAAKDLDLYWVTTACDVSTSTLQLSGAGCQIVAQSTAVEGTSEMVTASAAAGQTIRFIVINYTSGDEAITLRVVVDPN